MRKKNQRCKVGWSLIVVLALLLSLAGGAVPTEKLSAASSDAASVFLDPPSQPAGVGHRVTVDIKIKNVSNLYGAEVHLSFDKTLLEVVDEDGAKDGTQIAPSSELFPFVPGRYFIEPETGKKYYHDYSADTGGYFIAQSEADNTAGTISYVIILLDPALAVSAGTEGETLATITFKRKVPGTDDINFVNPVPGELPVKLADAAGSPISILTENIHGAVILQEGVPAIALAPTLGPVGTVVTVAGTGFAPNSSVDVTFDADSVVTVTTHTDGSFIATFIVPDVAAGDYTVTATDGTGNAASATFSVVIPTEMVDISIQPPTKTVLVGETFTLDIQAEAGGQSVTGVSAFVDFDPTYLEVVSITPGNTLDVPLLNRWENAAGTVDYSAGKLTEPFPSGTFVVATIEFKALEETPATAIHFSTSEPRETMADFGGTDVTGTITGGIVEVIPEVPVDISMVLQGGARPDEGWEVPVVIKFFEPGADVLTDTPVKRMNVTTVKIVDRAVARARIVPGTYDITVASETTLINVRRNVEIAPPAPVLDMGTLLEGNANGDHIINITDFGILAVSYMKAEGDEAFDKRADFDRNGIVNIADFGLLAVNFMNTSPVEIPRDP